MAETLKVLKEKIDRVFSFMFTGEAMGPNDKPQVFRNPYEFNLLQHMPPEKFVSRLSDEQLAMQVAGAAHDSFYAQHDTDKAAEYLGFLGRDIFWERYTDGIQDMSIYVARLTAFLIKHDGLTLEHEQPFLAFCREQNVDVTDEKVNDILRQLE